MNKTVGSTQDKKPRLLVFIVAYNAEKTISKVLQRIPDTLLAYDTEVLIIDDASQDTTFEKGHEAKVSADLPFKLNVLFNPVNQGYGGNQKVGYHYAIRNNFDLVVLLHGDGQYAPEMLPDLVRPIISGEADAVFGSRMMTRFGALKGGMPLYKFVGNKILTKFQNFVLGLKLSEFHSGYRAYSIDALSRIPFHLNTNEFHFDTEIIIQLALAKRRIKEIPIPTYYGDEISRVNGLRYAKDVFKTTLVAWIQVLSLLYHRKFDVADPEDGSLRYEAKMAFDSSHTEVVKYVDSSTSVLDLGCGVGHVAKALCEKGCGVTGVDIHQPSDTTFFSKFIEGDLNDRDLEISLAGYDYVLLLDVIEHLREPERFVEALVEKGDAEHGTKFVITTGNIAFFVTRILHLFGQFNYGKRGILDLTHNRLFTFRALRRLLEESGFRVAEIRGVPAPYPQAIGEGAISNALLWLNKQLIKISRTVFAYQIFLVAKPMPTLDWLLRSAETESAQREKTIEGNRILERTRA